jgi:hypothetical protein
MFGDAPILSTEYATRYWAMIAAFAERIDPQDFITWCYVKDFVDYQFEIWRYRMMKVEAVDNAYQAVKDKRILDFRTELANARTRITTAEGAKATAVIKARRLQGEEHNKCVAEMERKIEVDVKEREKSLQESINYWREYEPNESDLASQLHVWIGQHNSLDLRISVAEEKRARVLEDLERHLFGFGKALRERLHQVIEGEVAEVARPPEITDSPSGSAPRTPSAPFWSTLRLGKRAPAEKQCSGGAAKTKRRGLGFGDNR